MFWPVICLQWSVPGTTSLHNIGALFQDLSSPYIKKIKLLFQLHVTTEKNMEKFSPHYQMIPLYLPAIRKVLPLIISYPYKLLLWPQSDRDWLLKPCGGPECRPWLDIHLTRALKCEIKVSKYSFMFWNHFESPRRTSGLQFVDWRQTEFTFCLINGLWYLWRAPLFAWIHWRRQWDLSTFTLKSVICPFLKATERDIKGILQTAVSLWSSLCSQTTQCNSAIVWHNIVKRTSE